MACVFLFRHIHELLFQLYIAKCLPRSYNVLNETTYHYNGTDSLHIHVYILHLNVCLLSTINIYRELMEQIYIGCMQCRGICLY